MNDYEALATALEATSHVEHHSPIIDDVLFQIQDLVTIIRSMFVLLEETSCQAKSFMQQIEKYNNGEMNLYDFKNVVIAIRIWIKMKQNPKDRIALIFATNLMLFLKRNQSLPEKEKSCIINIQTQLKKLQQSASFTPEILRAASNANDDLIGYLYPPHHDTDPTFEEIISRINEIEKMLEEVSPKPIYPPSHNPPRKRV